MSYPSNQFAPSQAPDAPQTAPLLPVMAEVSQSIYRDLCEINTQLDAVLNQLGKSSSDTKGPSAMPNGTIKDTLDNCYNEVRAVRRKLNELGV